MDKIIEHRVILYITKREGKRTLSDKQLEKWVEHHLLQSDYGDVRVADVITEEKRKA